MHRFFIDQDNISGNIVEIEGNDYQHISHSLRLQSGDKVIVAVGDGYDLIVELQQFSADRVKGRIVDKQKCETETNLNVTLAQAIPKNRNMELVVQKTTELGIKRVIPVSTQRTIVKLKGKKRKKRVKRWQRIAKEAAKQSQRGIIPQIEDIHKFRELKKMKNDFDLILVFWASENKQNLSKIIAEHKNSSLQDILILVGPEGGFTEKEIGYIQHQLGGYPLTLGPRILRTETAGLVGLTAILYELGDLGG